MGLCNAVHQLIRNGRSRLIMGISRHLFPRTSAPPPMQKAAILVKMPGTTSPTVVFTLSAGGKSLKMENALI